MTKRTILTLAALACLLTATGQVKEHPDTLQCHVIGFSFGTLVPGSGSSSIAAGGNMRDLYKPPYLDFGLEADYKYASGWMMTLNGDMWIGYNSDNLLQRVERMGDVYTDNGYAMSWSGVDGVVTAYNRSLAARIGVAKIIRVLPDNPNSGILLGLGAGWMMQKTVFVQDMSESAVPQVTGDYGKLYDHLRNGAMLTQSVGFCYMSNYQTYINLKVELTVSECLMWSSRQYQIDNLMGLNGKDNNRYFDMLYGVKLTWMFPLMGKTTYDYYYY